METIGSILAASAIVAIIIAATATLLWLNLRPTIANEETNCDGDNWDFPSAGDMLDGKVLVQYFTTDDSRDDQLVMTFFARGHYEASFAFTPSTDNNEDDADLPENFVYEIEDSPRAVVIDQYVLPDYLDITIVYQDETDTKTFH